MLARMFGVESKLGELLDPIALKIIQRSKIPVVLGKCSVEFIRDVVKGKSVGTKVISNNEK